MTQQVVVVRMEEGRVLVSAGVAHTLFGERERRYWAINRLNARLGGWVEVGQSSGRALLEAFLFLGVPVLLVFLLYHLSAGWFTGDAERLSRVLLSFLGLPLGFLVFKAVRSLLPSAGPEVVRVLDEAPDVGEGCGNGCVCRANTISPARIDGDGPNRRCQR